MIGQKRSQVRTQEPGEEIAEIWLQNSAGDASIGAHQIDDIACERRQVATCGEGIENCTQSLLHPPPVRTGNMCEDVADMRLAAQAGNDEESEIADGDLAMVMGDPSEGPGYISSVFKESDRIAVDLSRYLDLLQHYGTHDDVCYASYQTYRELRERNTCGGTSGKPRGVTAGCKPFESADKTTGYDPVSL